MRNTQKTAMLWRLLCVMALIMIFVFSGCTAEKEGYTEMSIDYGKRADGSTYTVYNGDAQKFFGVSEGKENVVDVTVKKESGTLRIVIHKENDPDAVIYDGHDFPAEHFTVTVKEQGRYRILVHAENFVGSYQFSCDMGQ